MTKIDPVEFDVDMDRLYIPVNTRYEIQTKGKGSSFRIANMMTHERWLITDEHLHPMLTELAYGTHAELTQAQSKIERLEAKLERETGRADAWVEAVRDLARELGTPDEDSNGSIQDWKRITAKAKQVAELTAKLDKAREALKYLDDAFDNEMWNCERCGHAESTKDMDSASYLKNAIREKNG